jgi:hypothetical protein
MTSTATATVVPLVPRPATTTPPSVAADEPPSATASRSDGEAVGFLGLGGLRLTRRGRFVTILVALLVAAPAVLFGAQAVAGAPAEPVEVRLHAVVPGETLWDFARELAAPGQDLRDVVHDLRELNGMSHSSLAVGQVIALPVS